MAKKYLVQLNITRHITAVISASDALEARKKASNLEFKQQIDGGIIAWTVVDLEESDAADSSDDDLGFQPQADQAG